MIESEVDESRDHSEDEDGFQKSSRRGLSTEGENPVTP